MVRFVVFLPRRCNCTRIYSKIRVLESRRQDCSREKGRQFLKKTEGRADDKRELQAAGLEIELSQDQSQMAIVEREPMVVLLLLLLHYRVHVYMYVVMYVYICVYRCIYVYIYGTLSYRCVSLNIIVM